jgi:hypothetical protein
MKKQGLRGVLLGVSLVMFLAGGIALAQGLVVTADQDCVECYPLPEEPNHALPPEEYRVDITVSGWDYDVPLCWNAFFEGEPMGSAYCRMRPAVQDPLGVHMSFPCELDGNNMNELAEGIVTTAQYDITDYYGEWMFYVWQPDGESASVTWLLAEDCEALEEEFVPEAGSMILLGTGLAGLAGYATLRWRTRE